MSIMKYGWTALLLALPAAADEVVLRNGSVFSGVVREEGDRVTIRMDYGTMSFRRIDVREIRMSDDPLKELETRERKVSTPQEAYALALWAKEKGLKGRSDELMKRVLGQEPDHEGARQALGYEKLDGRWLKDDELKTARGLVKHRGRWLPKDTVEQILARETAETIENERQKTLRQAAEASREIELQRIALERERIEAELEKARRLRTWYWGGWTPVCPPVIVLPPNGPGLHPGHGPGRALPPTPERLYPGGLPSVTPPHNPRTTK